MLTILAEENLHFAKDIVAIIEAQISKVFINIEFSNLSCPFLNIGLWCEARLLVNMADAPRHVNPLSLWSKLAHVRHIFLD